MDRIYIKDLEVFANHGVYPEENKLGQKFVISADLSVDVRMAGLTDEPKCNTNGFKYKESPLNKGKKTRGGLRVSSGHL